MNLKTKENRIVVKDFLEQAMGCGVSTPKGIDINRMRIADGFVFEESDEVRAAQNKAVNRIIKSLGSVKGHDGEIVPVLWQSVVDLIRYKRSEASPSDVSSLLDLIALNASLEVQVVKPCHNVTLQPGTNSVVVGPVKIMRSASALSSLRKACPNLKISVGAVSEIESNGLNATLPTFIWQVTLVAAKKVREEHAAWLVDIALSLLRLGIKVTDLGINAPTIGKVEAPPYLRTTGEENRITIGPNSKYSFGGLSMPYIYGLGLPSQRALNRREFARKSDLVFSARTLSLAQRFAQGLGWMSRGRQSADRSTRLLYFFTAMESLLSDSDKNSPVVQTVARHAAVLLNDDNRSRASIARTVRQLYGLRSSLVHTGKRGVVERDANTIQYIAELLFQRVWEDVELSMEHYKFVEVLRTASYGTSPEF